MSSVDDLIALGASRSRRGRRRRPRSAPRVSIAVAGASRPAGHRHVASGLARLAREQPGVPLGRVAALQQVARRAPAGSCRRRRGGARSRATASSDHLAVVGDELERERQAGAERRVGERALAEAVDREDRRFVEGLQRLVERSATSSSRAAPPRRSQRVDERGTNGSPPGAAAPPSRRQASVSTMRARTRSRSSAVAALVKVTTRMLLHRRARVRAAAAGTARRCSRSCRCRPRPRSG